MQSIPESKIVDVFKLSGIFNKTTNSYKYLFFLSLLDILNRRNFEITELISFSELIVEILANSWFPHVYFKLSFGVQDQITNKLDSLNLVITEPILKFRDTDKKLLRQTIKAQLKPSIVNDLCRFVPYRLIRPFLTQETKNIDKNRLHQVIVEVVNQKFETLKPLYCFNSNNLKECTGIWISPDWADYLKENFAIVKGWAAWEWLKYMQAKNPTTPNIVNKLFMPQQRGSLSSQTKFWSIVLKYKSLHCIYSGQILDLKRLSLDHYLPWSFVAHDQLWNLVPVVPEVNSSKSNNLPSEKYFPEFVRLQHLALTTNHEYLPKKSWDKTIDVYVSDLNLTTDDLLNYEKLFNAYEATIKPLTTLAVKQGFPSGWVYSK